MTVKKRMEEENFKEKPEGKDCKKKTRGRRQQKKEWWKKNVIKD